MQCEYYALEGLSRPGRHDQARAREPQSRARNRRPAAHHVRPAEHAFAAGFAAARSSTSATRCTARWCRATCGSPRRRATACRRWCGTRPRRARRPISRSPTKCSRRDEPHDETQGPGPRPRRAARRRTTTRRRARRWLTLPVARIRPGQVPAAHARWTSRRSPSSPHSIRTQGLMQPLLVRPVGPRPLRAHRGRAALARGADGRTRTKCRRWCARCPTKRRSRMALIENIQREDLNPMEEAAGVQRLIDEFKMTHEQAADAVGRSRSATTNLLRLLKLARPVQEMLMEGALDMGHARALLALDAARQIEAAQPRRGERPVGARDRGPGAASCAARPSPAAQDAARPRPRAPRGGVVRSGSAPRSRSAPARKGSGKLVFTTRASITSTSCSRSCADDAILHCSALTVGAATRVTSTGSRTPCFARPAASRSAPF